MLSREQKTKDTYCMIDSVYITLLKWQNSSNGEQISDCQGLRLGLGSDCKGVVPANFFVIMAVLYPDYGSCYTNLYGWSHTHTR